MLRPSQGPRSYNFLIQFLIQISAQVVRGVAAHADGTLLRCSPETLRQIATPRVATGTPRPAMLCGQVADHMAKLTKEQRRRKERKEQMLAQGLSTSLSSWY